MNGNTRLVTLSLAVAMTLLAEADVTLQKAIRKETLEGDLKGAIALYAKAVEEAKNDRAVMAKALVRMAECHQKLGDSESRRIYERIVRDYADQKEAVTIARTRLGAGSAGTTPARRDRPVWTGREVDIFGRISGDGRWLTYTDWFETGNLMLHDMSTGKDYSLTKNKSWADGPGQAQFSSISPDGKRVAYEWYNAAGHYDLLIADLRGTALGESTPLVRNPEMRTVRPFEWSPDGKWIAIHITRQDNTSQIGLVSLENGSVRVLRSVDWRGPDNMAFSSDSRPLQPRTHHA
jgi:hypothetical protein